MTVRHPLASLPLRVRLVTGFVVAMTILLAGTGAFVYWRVRVDLDTALDRDLADQLAAIIPVVGADGVVDTTSSAIRLPLLQEFQTLTRSNVVLSSSLGTAADTLLTASDFRRALAGPVHVQIGAFLPASPRPLRLLAAPLDGSGRAAVVVVGVQRDQRDEALRELLATLVLAGFGALIIAAFVGERLAKAALAPVERYRAQASSIASGASGIRLEVPTSRDDEVTRLGHTFNDVLGALEHAMDRERRFVHDASHELRTPLTLLMTRVQLQRRRQRSVAEHEHALAELETDIADLIHLSDQLLDLGHGRDSPEQTDAAAVIRAMPLAHLGVDAQVDDEEAFVSVPAAQIRQIVSNLIANARVHGQPPIELRVRSEADVIVVSISDSGTGMSADFVGLAVERFTRADDAASRSGSGLGLAIVEAIVHRHDGELRLCSGGDHYSVHSVLSFACEHPTSGFTSTVGFRTP